MKTNKERVEQVLKYHEEMQKRNYDKEKELVDELQQLRKGQDDAEIAYTNKQLSVVRGKIQTTVQFIADLEGILNLWTD